MSGKLLNVLKEYIYFVSYKTIGGEVVEKTIILPHIWFENIKKECAVEFYAIINTTQPDNDMTDWFSIMLHGVKLKFYTSDYDMKHQHDTDEFFQFIYDNL